MFGPQGQIALADRAQGILQSVRQLTNIVEIDSAGGALEALAAPRENFPRGNPMLRQGDVQDIAHAVIYLTGPSGKFITGELLNVDGGGVLWGELWTIPKPAYFTQGQSQ